MGCGLVKLCAVAVAVVAASLCHGAALAQGSPTDTPPSAQQNMKPQPAPLDVPPEFLKPQNPESAPARSEPPQGEQQQNAPAAALIGAWEFSNADHNKICRFNFRSETANGGYRLDIDKNCPSLFPSTRDIVAWATDNYGDVRLLDAAGNAVVELTQVEGGMYDGFTPEEGRYILQTAAAAPVRSADDMVGDWAVTRGTGKPICALTLTNSPAGDGLALKLKPGCDALVTRFAPSGWRMDQGALVLFSVRGQTWQFEESDANTWQRVPESADPILLTRQQ